MEDVSADGGAFGEAVVFLRHFRDLPDPRQRGKVTYPLDEVLLVCLLGVLAGSETFVDIARFGDRKLEPVKRPGRPERQQPLAANRVDWLREDSKPNSRRSKWPRPQVPVATVSFTSLLVPWWSSSGWAHTPISADI